MVYAEEKWRGFLLCTWPAGAPQSRSVGNQQLEKRRLSLDTPSQGRSDISSPDVQDQAADYISSGTLLFRYLTKLTQIVAVTYQSLLYVLYCTVLANVTR